MKKIHSLTKVDTKSNSDKYKFKPRVAINNLIFTKQGELLLVKRSKKDGLHNIWGGIGGKIEYLESAESASIRELKEETGLKLSKPIFVGVTENISEYPHYVVLWFAYLLPHKKKINIDYSENSEYSWFPIDRLPSPIGNSTKIMITQGRKVISSKNSLRSKE